MWVSFITLNQTTRRITYPILAQAVEKCHNSNACFCDGNKGSAQKVKILGYKLYDLNESFIIKVKAGFM